MTLTDALIYGATAPALLFPLAYHRTARWYASELGRHTMALAVGIALILGLVAAARIFGADYPGRTWIRTGIYGFLAVILWQRLYLLLKTQGRRK